MAWGLATRAILDCLGLASRAPPRAVPLEHGEAVAIGTVFALGLPSALPALDGAQRDALAEALAHDKKRAGGEQPWVLPVRAGAVLIAPIPSDTAGALLAEELARPRGRCSSCTAPT